MVLYGFHEILYTQSHLSSEVALCDKYGSYHSHLTDEETRVHKDQITCPRTGTWVKVELN